ncbi:hypothetical protein EV644_12520 [Kribbella orskensis]|uniref:Uncharacterized protein n=1 Tax=Kribbella orskensis TaxID=2512216 RepID=A0ABY2BBJ7_9ACTN|nr:MULTISPECIES: hypothetical protein [Kribbella]TCN32297.1 hypothetical protein EV642_12771 [Kribbella sp. VKM Ac-2500]TCO12608.1 hypothetical protein EV644_12520 [Kribbella orskensis]
MLPALLLSLSPGLLRVPTGLLTTGALAPTTLPWLLPLPWLLALARVLRLLAPSATLLRRLALARLDRRLTGLLAAGALAPATATLARLLSPATLPWLSPLPALLAPRLPRTPRPLWRRRHMRSLETHV